MSVSSHVHLSGWNRLYTHTLRNIDSVATIKRYIILLKLIKLMFRAGRAELEDYLPCTT